MASGLTVSGSDSGLKLPGFDSANHFLVGALASFVTASGTRLLLAGEERSLDEWGKIRLFEVGPHIPPWRDSLIECRERRYRKAMKMAGKAARCNEGSACPEH